METVGLIRTLNILSRVELFFIIICVFPNFILAENKNNKLIQRSATNSTHKHHLAVFHLGYIYMYKQYIFIRFLGGVFNAFR